MAGVQHLLRKAALEKMSSPEKLDMSVRVVQPRGWVALAAFGVLIVAAVAYSVFGEVPVRVDATGILLRGDQVRTVQATSDGVVERLEVEEGEVVLAGQVVARLAQPVLESEIRASEERIGDLERQARTHGSQLRGLRRSLQQQLDDLALRRRRVEELVEKQIKTGNDLAAIDAQISGVRAQMFQAEMGESQGENQLAEERRRMAQLLDRRESGGVVRSPYSGRVAAVLKPEGQIIREGERLLNLEEPDAPLHVLLFVPFAEGKRVKVGMPVRISPSTVKPEEYGFILGTIEQLSSQPVTPEEVRATLNNDQLAQRFAEDTPFRVRAVPELDPKSPSGFAWTSSSGPPHPVGGNTPCAAQIVIEDRSPISYVIPALRKTLGVQG